MSVCPLNPWYFIDWSSFFILWFQHAHIKGKWRKKWRRRIFLKHCKKLNLVMPSQSFLLLNQVTLSESINICFLKRLIGYYKISSCTGCVQACQKMNKNRKIRFFDKKSNFSIFEQKPDFGEKFDFEQKFRFRKFDFL
jgi:hypothetical protein